MYNGAIILESLRVGTSLEDIPLVVRKLSRHTVTGTTADQPSVWTVLEFEVNDIHAVALAEALKGVLDKPGWYADFHNEREIFVVFPGRIFRYLRGDKTGCSEAQAYGRELGVPAVGLGGLGSNSAQSLGPHPHSCCDGLDGLAERSAAVAAI